MVNFLPYRQKDMSSSPQVYVGNQVWGHRLEIQDMKDGGDQRIPQLSASQASLLGDFHTSERLSQNNKWTHEKWHTRLSPDLCMYKI